MTVRATSQVGPVEPSLKAWRSASRVPATVQLLEETGHTPVVDHCETPTSISPCTSGHS